jgi:hypothetical protein
MAQQVAGATVATRPQPQTTQNAGPGPFIAHAVHASRPGYNHAGVTLGGVVTDPLPQAPGYLRKLRFSLLASGGGTGSTVTATVDMQSAVAQVIQLLQLKDPMGTPIITGSGFDMLYLAPLYSGQVGILRSADITLFPTYAAVKSSGNTDTGNFGCDAVIPLEGTLAYGVVAVGNASALPTLLVNLNASAQIYTTAPSAAPTVAVTVDYDYYAIADPTIEPPGLGTTFQWQSVPANPTIGNAASQRVQLPRTAGYLHTLILVMRDSTGARIDGYGSRIRLYVDGVPVYDDTFGISTAAQIAAGTFVSSWVLDRMFLESGGNVGAAGTPPTTRPVGTIAYSFRESIAQINLGLADTQLRLPPITPGTLLEIECTPWGTVTNAPAVLTAIYGMVVPRGMLITGLPQDS